MKTKIFRQCFFTALKKVSAHDKRNIFPTGDSVRHNIRPEHLHRLQDLQVKQVQEELQVTHTISKNYPRNIQNPSFFSPETLPAAACLPAAPASAGSTRRRRRRETRVRRE